MCKKCGLAFFLRRTVDGWNSHPQDLPRQKTLNINSLNQYSTKFSGPTTSTILFKIVYKSRIFSQRPPLIQNPFLLILDEPFILDIKKDSEYTPTFQWIKGDRNVCYIQAEQPEKEKDPWIPLSDEDQKRQSRYSAAACQRPKTNRRIVPGHT